MYYLSRNEALLLIMATLQMTPKPDLCAALDGWKKLIHMYMYELLIL